MIEGLVLDVDDTLYLEREYVRSGFRAVGEWVRQTTGVTDVAEIAWNLFLDGKRGTTLTDAVMTTGLHLTDELRRQVIGVYRGHVPDIQMLGDARALLDAIPEGTPIAVITDGPGQSQANKCKVLGLTTVAHPLVLTADYGRSKPDPWCFLNRLPAARRDLYLRKTFNASCCESVAFNATKFSSRISLTFAVSGRSRNSRIRTSSINLPRSSTT